VEDQTDTLAIMKALANNFAIRQVQGFTVHVLSNEEVELAVATELGAKIISLKDLQTRREWLWHPQGNLKLFRNHPGDDFSISPLVGIDECLPTILPCSWRGRELPDHGEVWNLPWQVDGEAWENGILKTSTRLKISPFALERTIELHGNEVHIGYTLNNLSATVENFVWAIHPLLRLETGDQLELPDSTRKLLNGEAWINAVASAIPERNCAKVFARPVSEGWAAIKNEAQGDRLEFAWDSAENNTLGLWLTRGGWHGHHHFAMEPTNAGDDSLAVAAVRKHCGAVAGNGSVTWQLCLRVGL
jgi:hypothetical protein